MRMGRTMRKGGGWLARSARAVCTEWPPSTAAARHWADHIRAEKRHQTALAELEAAGRAGTVRGARGEMSSRRWIRRLPALAAGSEIAAGKLKQVWQRGSQYRRYRQSYVV